MSEIKLYQEQEPALQAVNEVAAMYESPSRSMDDFIKSLPRDAMRKLIDFAIEEQYAGRCIPNSQVDDFLNQRLGWK